MEVRRSTQAILRTNWTPFINASLSRAASSQHDLPTSHHHLKRRIPTHPMRCRFSTTIPSRQQAAARREEDDTASATSNEPQQPMEPAQRVHLAERHTTETTAPRQRSARSKDSGLNFLNRARLASDTPPNRSTSPQQPSQRPSTSFNAHDLVPGASEGLNFLRRPTQSSPQGNMGAQPQSPGAARTSVDEMLAGFRSAPRTTSTPFRAGDKSSADLGSMIRPGSLSPLATQETSAKVLADQRRRYETALTKAMAAPGFRLGPGLGRTVAVDEKRSMDVARAFQMVNVKCAANSVKQDMQAQRFHERPGMRKKRLVSQRWRRRFKEAFKATVRRVEDMRRKGW